MAGLFDYVNKITLAYRSVKCAFQILDISKANIAIGKAATDQPMNSSMMKRF